MQERSRTRNVTIAGNLLAVCLHFFTVLIVHPGEIIAKIANKCHGLKLRNVDTLSKEVNLTDF